MHDLTWETITLYWHGVSVIGNLKTEIMSVLYSSTCRYIKYVGDGGNFWFTPLSSMELNSSRFRLNLMVDNCTTQFTNTRSLQIVAVNLSTLLKVNYPTDQECKHIIIYCKILCFILMNRL